METVNSSVELSGRSKNGTEKRIPYLTRGFKAEPHTAIYKMHKYFARRPQNVFRKLVEHYVPEHGIVLDPFCGGGVTAFEALASGRSVVASDYNPLATFITRAQVNQVDLNTYTKIIKEIRDEVASFASKYFETEDRTTEIKIPVRWYEHAYLVNCPECRDETALTNEAKKRRDGETKNGWYTCEKCEAFFAGVDTPRFGSRLISVTYKTGTRATQKTVIPDQSDLKLFKSSKLELKKLQSRENLPIPDTVIPENWDRQKEDCLHRKGITQFSQLFTDRNLIVMGYFLKQIRMRRESIQSEALYRLLLLTFSSTLRYTNNLTISTSSWMDGRPVAWAKHAYWISNQFVEVNPIEYIDKRITAISAALRYQDDTLHNTKEVKSLKKIDHRINNYMVLTGDSSCLPLAEESIDAVITDPPYGSNVQYGELSAFWLVWIKEDIGISERDILGLGDEVLINRKVSKHSKDHFFYYNGLKKVFGECHRVLKRGKPMVFTFNNKDPIVWAAMIKAAIDAGFSIEEKGIIYQEPIENYVNTAHTRFEGSVLGDFIYTFVKSEDTNPKQGLVFESGIPKQTDLEKLVRRYLAKNPNASLNEVYITALRRLTLGMVNLATEHCSFENLIKIAEKLNLDRAIASVADLDTKKSSWTIRGNHQ